MKKSSFLILIVLITTPFLGIVISANYSSNLSNKDDKKYREDYNVDYRDDYRDDITNKNPKTSANNKNWTFMVYLDADCNLESVGIEDINEMEVEGSDENISIVVQIDRILGYDSSNGDWTGARRYNVSKDSNENDISSTVVQDLGEVNMGSPDTLQDFIQWAKSNYLADNYALILWDHGSGVMNGNSPGGVCWDDSNGGDYLTLSEIYSVISSNRVDLLGFDACLMGSVEVHYQLKDCVDVIVGSEDNEPNDGYPYNDILNFLKSNPAATSEQLGEAITLSYNSSYPDNYDVTQAAIRAFTSEFNNSLTNFINDLNRVSIGQIRTARSASLEFSTESYIDLYDFADELNGVVGVSAQHLMDNITAIVIKEAHSTSQADAHGLTIYFPRRLSSYSSNYENTQFALDFNWDEFLVKYYTSGLPGDSDDNYEENDEFTSAVSLSPGQYDLFCNASDFDFYKVSVTAGNKLEVKIVFEHDQGNLNLYLFNTSQIEVNCSESITDNESLSYIAPITGYYTILVSQTPFHIEYQPYTMILAGSNEIESSKTYLVNEDDDNNDDDSDDSEDKQIYYIMILSAIVAIVGAIVVTFIVVRSLRLKY